MFLECFVRQRDIVVITASFGGIFAIYAANVIDAGKAGIALGTANYRGIKAFAIVEDEAFGTSGNASSIFADRVIFACWIALFVGINQSRVDTCTFDADLRADAFGGTEVGIDAVIVDADFAGWTCRTADTRVDACPIDAEFTFGCIAFGIAIALGYALVIVANLGFIVAARRANLPGSDMAIVVGTNRFAHTNGRANRFGVDAYTTDTQLFIGACRIAFSRDAHPIDANFPFGRVTGRIAGIVLFDAGIVNALFIFFAFGIAQIVGIFARSMIADFACRAAELTIFLAEIRVVANAIEAFQTCGTFGTAHTGFFAFLIDANGVVTTYFGTVIARSNACTVKANLAFSAFWAADVGFGIGTLQSAALGIDGPVDAILVIEADDRRFFGFAYALGIDAYTADTLLIGMA